MAKKKTGQKTVATYLLEVAKRKGKTTLQIQEIIKALEGKILLVTSTAGGHNYPLGGKLKVDDMVSGGMHNISGFMNPITGFGGNSIPTGSMVIVENTAEAITEGIKERKASIKELEAEIKEQETLLTYLEKTGKTEVVEDEYKEYQLNELLSSEATVEKKKAAIKKLFA
jgi:hypothetical protein